jgi:hypothetical protein
MFGRRFFGRRFYAPGYFGDGGSGTPPTVNGPSKTSWFYRRRRFF